MQSDTEILEYLKTLKFKRSLFGVSRKDALEKMRVLNLMYQRQQKAMGTVGTQTAASEQYEKKIEALTTAFVSMQEQADGIIGQAEKQAEKLTEDAKRNAEEIIEQARRDSEQILARQKQESEQLLKKKESLMQELKRVSDTLNQMVQQNFGGEISAQPR